MLGTSRKAGWKIIHIQSSEAVAVRIRCGYSGSGVYDGFRLKICVLAGLSVTP